METSAKLIQNIKKYTTASTAAGLAMMAAKGPYDPADVLVY